MFDLSVYLDFVCFHFAFILLCVCKLQLCNFTFRNICWSRHLKLIKITLRKHRWQNKCASNEICPNSRKFAFWCLYRLKKDSFPFCKSSLSRIIDMCQLLRQLLTTSGLFQISAICCLMINLAKLSPHDCTRLSYAYFIDLGWFLYVLKCVYL